MRRKHAVLGSISLAALLCGALTAGCKDDSRSAVVSLPASTVSGTSPTQPLGDITVGVAAVPITPRTFEGFSDLNADGEWQASEPWHDTGVDLLFDFQEPGALGADGRPGRAGVDDDGDGVVDGVSEYMSAGSDDVFDPAGDNRTVSNPGGTEGNGHWEQMRLAGFGSFIQGSNRYASGVHDPLWARTLVVEKGGTIFVWQSLDLVGMLHIDINPVKRQVERVFGVPQGNVVICSTHNHASPDSIGLWAGDVDEPYWAWVRARMFESIERAMQARRPARMKSVSAEPVSGYDPQTLALERGAAVRTADALADHKAGVAAGTHDAFLYQTDLRDPVVRATEIVALQFDDPTSGEVIATLVNWHDHPEIMENENLQITSDFPHFLRERIESRLGGVCVYVSGAVGCQIGALHRTEVPERDPAGAPVFDPTRTGPGGAPFPKLVSRPGWTKIRSVGVGIADEAIDALASASYTVDPQLKVQTEPLYVDLENPGFLVLSWLLKRFRSPYLNPTPDDMPITGVPGFASPLGVLKVHLTVASIGDAQLVTSPGETAPEYFFGRAASSASYGSWGTSSFPAMPALRDHMTGRDKMIASLSDSYVGYLVPRTDTLPLWDYNHPNFYEEMVSAGPNFGDNVGNKLMQMLGAPIRFSAYPSRP